VSTQEGQERNYVCVMGESDLFFVKLCFIWEVTNPPPTVCYWCSNFCC